MNSTLKILLASAAVLALPAGAQAAVVDGKPGAPDTLVFKAAAGEANDLAVSDAGAGGIRFRDRVALTVGPFARSSCLVVAANDVVCRREPQFSRIEVSLEDGDDVVTATAPLPTSVAAGAGNDRALMATRPGVSQVSFAGQDGVDEMSYAASTVPVILDSSQVTSADGRPSVGDRDVVAQGVEILTGSPQSDTLRGNASAEVFRPGLGDDIVTSGGGADRYEMDATRDGADRVLGSGQGDLLTYAARTAPLSISVNTGGANDGEVGEGDEIDNVNGVEGGRSGDTISAFSKSAQLSGPAGGQRLAGGPVTGFRLSGGPGDDTLQSGAGADSLDGGPGLDTLRSGGGDDRLATVDGEADKLLDCGEGRFDIFRKDAADPIAGCEVNLALLGAERRVGIVGKLRVASAEDAVTVAWEHPKAWSKLRAVRVQLRAAGLPVGEVTIEPKTGRLRSREVAIDRKRSKVVRRGRTLTAKIALPAGAGKVSADVLATDLSGRRQFEPSTF